MFAGIMGGVQSGFDIFSGLASIFGGDAQAKARMAQAQFVQKGEETNAQLAELAGQNAEQAGNEELSAEYLNSRRVMGQIRASYAAQGVQVNTGVSAQIQDDASQIASINEEHIKQRVYQEKFGYRMQATNDRIQGNMAIIGAQTAADAEVNAGVMSGISYGVKAGETLYRSLPANVPTNSSANAFVYPTTAGGNHVPVT